jgi:hypothetical protein
MEEKYGMLHAQKMEATPSSNLEMGKVIYALSNLCLWIRKTQDE